MAHSKIQKSRKNSAKKQEKPNNKRSDANKEVNEEIMEEFMNKVVARESFVKDDDLNDKIEKVMHLNVF